MSNSATVNIKSLGYLNKSITQGRLMRIFLNLITITLISLIFNGAEANTTLTFKQAL